MTPDRTSWWLRYWLCAALVAAAMIVVTVLVLRIEYRGFMLRAESERQNLLRLALWRMDSWLSPRLGREAARPYYEYQSFFPVDPVFNKFFAPVAPGEVIAPSPLLTFESEYFPIHFQIDASGEITSPQTPGGNELDRAQFDLNLSTEAVERKRVLLDDVRAVVDVRIVAVACAEAEGRQELQSGPAPARLGSSAQRGQLDLAQTEGVAAQQSRNWAENIKRQQVSQEIGQVLRQQGYGEGVTEKSVAGLDQEVPAVVGPLVPIWTEGSAADRSVSKDIDLLFVRRVEIGPRTFYQGMVADWNALRAALLEQAEDLIPDPDLVPVRESSTNASSSVWTLATIPAVLQIGAAPPTGPPLVTPARLTLGLTWLALLIAGIAAGLTLHSSIDFGRRRSRFASAVTHELRTPLTTFQMYSEMLAEGMVNDSQQRQTYYETLREESSRLNALVENVLAYARIEEGRARRQSERITLNAFFDQFLPAAKRRAEKAGASLEVTVGGDQHTEFEIDAETVSQILFNLLDNACKYGCGDEEKKIEIDAAVAADWLKVRVRDHGCGVDDRVVRRIFDPFERGSIEPGSATPGLGIGLALSRELAASVGGTLRYCRPEMGPGACFELHIPLRS